MKPEDEFEGRATGDGRCKGASSGAPAQQWPAAAAALIPLLRFSYGGTQHTQLRRDARVQAERLADRLLLIQRNTKALQVDSKRFVIAKGI